MNLYILAIAILAFIFSISYITHKITKYILYSIFLLFSIFFVIGFSKSFYHDYFDEDDDDY